MLIKCLKINYLLQLKLTNDKGVKNEHAQPISDKLQD